MENYYITFSHKINGKRENLSFYLKCLKNDDVKKIALNRLMSLGYKKIKIVSISKSKLILR